MTDFTAVTEAVLEVVNEDGTALKGTAFRVLPGGELLTCHHVVAGLTRIQVRSTDGTRVVDAEYLADLSDPGADVAVLRVPETEAGPAVQVTRAPQAGRAYGYGFRPGSLAVEPAGHTFGGVYTPGQRLEIPVDPRLLARLEEIAEHDRQPWNSLPPLRKGEVRNFATHGGVKPGISGGPVFDPDLRKVIGLFRAVEGESLAYVLPIDTVLEGWADLEQVNAEAVPDDALDELASGFGVLPAGAARPVRAIGLAYFDSLRNRREQFGGRERELEALDRFVAHPGGRYLFLTGDAGLGKTTLLLEWTSRLPQPDVDLAVHFISPRIDHGADQRFCLENLCEQLMAAQRLGGDLPVGEHRLRSLYASLLRLEPPPGRTLVVVIDGLDEALGTWTPGPDLFPHDLPPGTRVVFSARTMADTDWPRRLELDGDGLEVVRLSRMSTAELASVVEKTPAVRKEDRDAAVERLWEISEGDPYYLQDLLAELAQAGGSLDALTDYPVGHSDYLRRWWLEAAVADPAFVDVVGILAVSRAPLGRAELVAVSPDDAIRDVNFLQLIAIAARHVVGDETVGYQLASTRLREFVSAQLGSDVGLYQRRLVEYCRRWADPATTPSGRDYALAQLPHHLATLGEVGELVDLLDAGWITAKWRRSGSFAAVVEDIDLAGAQANRPDDPDVPTVAALAVARATCRSLTHTIPPQLISARAQLGDRSRLVELLREATKVSSGDLGADFRRVLAALESVPGEQDDDPEQAEFLRTLVTHAFALATAFSEPADQIAALQSLAASLERAPGAATSEILDSTAEAIPTLGTRAAQAAAIGVLGRIAATSANDQALGRRLGSEVAALTHDLRQPADRTAAVGYAVELVAALEGPDAAFALAQGATATDAPFAQSRLAGIAALPVVRGWSRLGIAHPPATPWLVDLAKGCIAADAGKEDHATAGELVGLAASCLVAAGELPSASELIEDAFVAASQLGAHAVVEVARQRGELPDVDWLARIANTAPPEILVLTQLAIGKADEALDGLSALPPESRPAVATEALDWLRDRPGTLDAPAITTRIVAAGLDPETPPGALAAFLAAAAATLAAADPERAAHLADDAAALCLTPPSRADTDILRTALAVALHAEDRWGEAALATRELDSSTAADVLAWLVESTGEGDSEAVRAYAEALLAVLQASGGDFDTVATAASTVRTLRELAPESAFELETEIQGQAEKLVEILPRVAAAASQDASVAERFGLDNARRLYSLVRDIAPFVPAADVTAAAGDLRTIGGLLSDVERPHSEVLYAETIGEVDRAEASAAIGALWSALESFEPEALFALVALCDQIEPVLDYGGLELGEALRRLLEATDRWGQVGYPQVFKALWNAIASTAPRLDDATLVDEALDATAAIADPDERTSSLAVATQALAAMGCVEAAGRALALLPDGENVPADVNTARVALEDARLRATLAGGAGQQSQFDSYFLEHDQTGLGAAIVREAQGQAREIEDLLATFTHALADDLLLGNRDAVVEAGVYPLLYPAFAVGGAGLVQAIVERVDELDGRFIEAVESGIRAATKRRAGN